MLLVGGYQQSMHYQDVTNYSFINGHFMMQESILQRTSTASLVDNQQWGSTLICKQHISQLNNQEINKNSHRPFYKTSYTHSCTHSHTNSNHKL